MACCKTLLKYCCGMLLFIFLFMVVPDTSAQSLGDFYDDTWAVYWVRTSMERSGNENPNPLDKADPEKYSYSGINLSWRLDNEDTWEWHSDYQTRFLGDLMYGLYHAIRAIDDKKDSDDYIDRIKNNNVSTGYFGDLNLGLNVFTMDWLVTSAGMNISDHFINDASDTGVDDSRSGHHAYHFALGAYGHADVAITHWLAARITVSAAKAISKKRALNSERIYKPVFLTIKPEIFTSFGLFAGLDFYRPIHDDQVSQKRMEIQVGWRF